MATLSVIGPTTTVRGGIRGEGDLDIQGRVEGSVAVDGEVTIGEGALIKSDVRARRVIVKGAVRGNVSADELLILEAGARVLGDLGAPQVGIRPGGLVKGHVSTSGPLPAERGKAAPAARATPALRGAPPRTAPAPARPVPRPAPPPATRAAPRVEHESPRAPARAASPAPEAPVAAAEPPPPVVPALPKGARATARKKGAK